MFRNWLCVGKVLTLYDQSFESKKTLKEHEFDDFITWLTSVIKNHAQSGMSSLIGRQTTKKCIDVFLDSEEGQIVEVYLHYNFPTTNNQGEY